MGVRNGSKFLHSCSKLTLSEVSIIANGLAARGSNTKAQVVVDCSNMVFIYNHYLNPIDAVAKHLAQLGTPGLVIVPVCDGPKRPVAKQATHMRNASREVCRIASIANRDDIQLLKHQVAKDPNANKDKLNKRIQTLSSKLKANERQASSSMPKNFDVELDQKLDQARAYEINDHSAGGYVKRDIVSEFQADAYMVGQIASGSAICCDVTNSGHSEQQMQDKLEHELTRLDVEMQSIWVRLQNLVDHREINHPSRPENEIPMFQPISTKSPRLLQKTYGTPPSSSTPPTEQSDSDSDNCHPSSPEKKK